MAKELNAAQRIFNAIFNGPVTYGAGRHSRCLNVRHQGVREMARRRRQMANGTHGL